MYTVELNMTFSAPSLVGGGLKRQIRLFRNRWNGIDMNIPKNAIFEGLRRLPTHGEMPQTKFPPSSPFYSRLPCSRIHA